MKKITLLLVILAIGLQPIWAQTREIAGVVTSSEDGSTIPGVSVSVKGTTLGTITNLDGKYVISTPEDAQILVFSFVGMQTLEIEITGNVINATLSPDVIGLNEVVVTAMGIQRERKALDYATQSVTSESLTIASQPNLSNALQGKIAGVTVSQSSGMPGASSYMTIRGATSLSGNNQPLFVVDGVPIESGSIFVNAATVDRVSGTDASSRSLDIDPDDIESIEVLKGATASALYGLRASNGVILITTKSGKDIKTGKGVITFSTSLTVDIVTRTPSLQSTYAQGANGNFNQSTSLSWGPKISELGTYTNIAGQEVQGKVYNNVDPFFENGLTSTNNINFSNGTETGNYSISFGYTDQNGVIPTTGMKRYTGKITGDFEISDKLKVGGSAMFSDMEVNKLASGSNLSNPLFTTYFAPRSFDLWGIPYAKEDDPYSQIHYRSAMDNPRWSLAHNKFEEFNDRVIGNIHLNYKILDYLSLNYQLGIDYVTNHQKEVYELGAGETGGRTSPPSGGQITDFAYIQRQYNSNLSLMFNKTINEFNVSATIGSEIYDVYSRELSVTGTGFDIGGYHNLDNTSAQTEYEYISKRRVAGIYGSMSVGWKSMLYLNATGRNDRVSNLARGNRDFFYPSVGVSWLFTETFKDLQEVLSYGKVRASYAQVGQAVDDSYPTTNIYIKGGAGSGFLSDGIELPLQGVNGFTQSTILRSPALKPQNTRTLEVGAELKFFNNRFGIDYTYFNSNVDDQIFQVPIAASTGYQAEFRNAGKLQSIGHEAIINISPIKNKDFSWDVIVNFTKYTNRVKKLAEGVSDIYLGGFTTPSIRALEGETYPSIFGVGYLRDDNGNIALLDDPGNPYHGMPIADQNSKKVGNVQPDFMMGFINTFNVYGVTVTAQVDWKKGGQMYSGNNRLGRLYGMLDITEDRETPMVLDGVKGYLDSNGDLVVTGDNDIAILRGQQYWNDVLGSIDEAHVYETSYVRFRELSIGYTIPKKLLKNTFINSINVSFIGRNLGLWTSYPNFDPETSTTGAVNGQGLEYVAFPQASSFGGKFVFTF
ncbi:SusC/RagA family TonB-linked outer membrane protein [Mangrovibacterium lignilyticum]|uniref:SusC/RagA family TonB-linked outer membrane protein n=1 Tax=Mangrovibacterium lignilyticum TaxID=2668052 RepID=UPI0013D0C1B1|nr:SusC/RagA family TonB-linked outer membrane protein [Mangrovibacterium lignilyticum]